MVLCSTPNQPASSRYTSAGEILVPFSASTALDTGAWRSWALLGSVESFSFEYCQCKMIRVPLPEH